MIRNRLSILLAEKSIKITRVAKDTGISRSTLNNISKNDTDMIRLETINTLCKYLNINPREFFEYEPLDIEFDLVVTSIPFKLETDQDRRILRSKTIGADLFMEIDWGHKKQTMDLTCELTSDFILKESKSSLTEDASSTMVLKIDFDEEEEEILFVKDIYNNIDGSFYKDIYNSLREEVKTEITKGVSSIIDSFIDKHLDLEGNPTQLVSFSDSFFAKDLEHSKNKINIEIVSEVFKPF